MKTVHFVLLVLTLTLLLAPVGCGEDARSPEEEGGTLRIGLAVEDITPDLEKYGTLRPLAYLFNPPVKGIKDRLYARAVVLDNGSTRVAWVTLDTCFVDKWFCDLVYEKTSCLPHRDLLFVTAVHVHGGIAHIQEQPLFQFLFGQIKPALRDDIAGRVALAIERAADDLQPVRLKAAAGALERLNQNRRPFYGRGFRDLGTDPELTALVFTDPGDRPVAVVANFAAHPTLTPTWEDPHFTSDFVGVFSDAVERALGHGLTFREGGRVFCMFTNGVEGDAEPYYPDPVQREIQTWDKRVEYGKKLAAAALPVIETAIGTSGRAAVVLKTNTLHLPMPKIVPAHPLIGLAQTVFPVIRYDIPVAALRLGDVLVSFFPGEPTKPAGLDGIKTPLAVASGLQTVLVALSNDYISYVPSREQYRESESLDNYERFICMFGPRTAEIFAHAVMESAKGVY